MEKPTLPKGTRDFGPAQMAKRQFILENIKKVFQKYGFQPLETPAMENLTTLTGKYGEEGDQLLFKVLDSGEYLEKSKPNIFQKKQIEKYAIEIVKAFNHANLGLSSVEPELLKVEFLNRKYLENLDYIKGLYQDENDQKIFDLLIKEKSYELLLKLIFFKDFDINKPLINVENSNEFLEVVKGVLNEWFFAKISSKELTTYISEKGLRYDLTVPFARYVVMNRHEITLPFKRYQIQPVWRADRPQKGRYREFYQCDADVVGTNSLICEAEIILMIREAFKGLGIEDYSIKTNHRGILSGLAELCGAKENETSLFVAIDKLDKIGEEKVKEELISRGFHESSLTTLFDVLNFKGTTQQKIEFLSQKFSSAPSGQKGVSDFSEVLTILSGYGVSEDHVEFDIALARGLSYYTGCIFEVKINNVSIGSVSGGGRYDNLTQAFGAKEQLSGVGISFGIDRIYDAMEELKLFPQEAQISTQVLIAHFDEESKHYGLKVLQTLRDNGIASEIYPDSVKIQKQLDFANKKMVPYTIVIGSEEIKNGMLAFKNMKTGEQQKLTIEKILDTFK